MFMILICYIIYSRGAGVSIPASIGQLEGNVNDGLIIEQLATYDGVKYR